MDSMPLISIAVPIYGVEKYIEKCAVSLFEQSYSNIEYVFVNDCTKDSSMDILTKVLERYPQRKSLVKIINNTENRGLAYTRNVSIKNCSGDYVFIVDSDDWIEVDTISKVVSLLNKDKSDIISVGTRVKYFNGEECRMDSFNSKEAYLNALLDKSVYCNIWGRLIKHSLFTDNNIECCEGANMGEDYCQIPRLVYYANKISFIDEPLYIYNFMNSNGYTINYSYNHVIQVWLNYNLLYDFFESKGISYKESLDLSFLRIICDHFRISKDSKDGEKIFVEERRKLTSQKLLSKNKLKFTDKMLINFSGNRKIVNVYLYVLSFFKKFLRKRGINKVYTEGCKTPNICC